MAVNNSIPVSIVSSPSDLEAVSVVCSLKFHVTFCVIYAPPNAPDSYHKRLQDYILDLVSSPKHVIVMGDFNYPDISWDRLTGLI